MVKDYQTFYKPINDLTKNKSTHLRINTIIMHEFYFEKLENWVGTSEKLITYVKDRSGYDLRMDAESDEWGVSELLWGAV